MTKRPQLLLNLLAAASVLLAGRLPFAQTNGASSTSQPATTTASSAPSFDVATIKRHPASAEGRMNWMGVRNDPDGIDAQFVTLQMVIQRAYGLRTESQITGVPEWAKTERFDIQARMSEPEIAALQKLSADEAKASREIMLQSLLAERFKLKVHTEIKQAPVYELVVAKGGPKMHDAATDNSAEVKKGGDGKPLSGVIESTRDTMTVQSYSMQTLADFLSQPFFSGLDRPVVNKTGLTARYDFTLHWSPELKGLPGEAITPSSPEESGSLFTALNDLGLKLQPATGPVETIVIDHAERPSED